MVRRCHVINALQKALPCSTAEHCAQVASSVITSRPTVTRFSAACNRLVPHRFSRPSSVMRAHTHRRAHLMLAGGQVDGWQSMVHAWGDGARLRAGSCLQAGRQAGSMLQSRYMLCSPAATECSGAARIHEQAVVEASRQIFEEADSTSARSTASTTVCRWAQPRTPALFVCVGSCHTQGTGCQCIHHKHRTSSTHTGTSGCSHDVAALVCKHISLQSARVCG